MNKLLALTMTLISIFSFSSCDLHEHKHIEGEWAYDDEYHWRSYTCCSCELCATAPEPISHSDENGDQLCDTCGWATLAYSANTAQILINYENNLKDEIEKLRKERPEYNYFYHPVEEIHCIYILNSNISADDIVTKYDMNNKFSGADVSALNAIGMVNIIFNRCDFTEAVHQKLKQINEDEPSIENLLVTMERDWLGSCVPKIEYYTDYESVLDYEIASNVINPDGKGVIIKSKEEYDNYLNRLLEKSEYDHLDEIIGEQKYLYDAAFFEENALIITNTITRSSSSIILTVNNLYVSENKVYAVVRTAVPGMCDDAMQYTHFTLSVPKNEVVNVKEVITLE